MDTDGRRVEAIQARETNRPEYGQCGQPNTDTPRRVEKKRPPPRCSFAPCAAFALSFDVFTSPPPFRAAGGQSLNTDKTAAGVQRPNAARI